MLFLQQLVSTFNLEVIQDDNDPNLDSVEVIEKNLSLNPVTNLDVVILDIVSQNLSIEAGRDPKKFFEDPDV